MQLPDLIKACKQQQLSAQKAFYDLFARSMFLLCRRYVKTDQQAEEVMMNGFLKCFQSLSGFSYVNEPALAAWLRKIMVNECLMHLRSANSFVLLTADELPDAGQPETVIEELTANEIFSLIIQLPIGYRTVFNLFVIEGMSHKDISKLLLISEGTSRSQLNKARQVLQQLLIKNNPEYGWRKTK